MKEWFWYKVYVVIGYIQCVTVRLRMYKLTFWLTDVAMLALDLWDGGYPEYKEEDWYE